MAGLPELFCICTRYIKHACCMPSLLETTFCKGTSCIPFIFVSHPFSNTETLFLALILQKHFCLLATSSSGVTSYLLSPHLVILKLIGVILFSFSCYGLMIRIQKYLKKILLCHRGLCFLQINWTI